MPQFNDVEVIQLDGQPFAVSAMSAEIQELMSIYNDWSRRAFDMQQELQMVNMAREAISQKIGQQHHNERAAAQQAADAAAADAATAAGAVAPDPEPAPTLDIPPTEAAANE